MWKSYYIQVFDDYEAVLAQVVQPVVAQLGPCERFFFIRYWERGLQLRLRFHSERDLGTSLQAHLLDYLGGRLPLHAHKPTGPDPEAAYLWPEAYSRTLHYFGDNRQSVYAELVNEQTSYLALKVLAQTLGHRQVRYVALLHVLRTLLAATGDFERHVAQSAAFAMDWLERHLDSASGDAADRATLLNVDPSTALSLLDDVPALGPVVNDPAVRQAKRLLQRLLREVDPFGFTHSLHLLCNKLGFDFYDELFAFRVLQAWYARAARP